MPNFQVTAPDGTNYQVTAPEGATQDQVMQYVQQQHAAKAPAPQPDNDAAFAAGKQAGQNSSGLVAGADQMARQYLPLGLGTDVGAAARYAGQRLTGVQNPDSFATDLAYSGGQSAGEVAGSPVASTVGGVVGGVGQAAALTPLMKAAMPFKASLALKTAAAGGTKLGNAAKLLTQGAIAGGELGGATGAVQGGINGGDPSVTGALEGAAGGTVTGGLEGAAGSALGGAVAATPAAVRAMFGDAGTKSIALLAKKFGVSPTDLGSTYAKFRLDTGGTIDPQTGEITGGRMPALGELTDLNNRGEIAATVKKNPNLGAAVAQASLDADSALPGRLNQAVAETVGTTPVPASPLNQASGLNTTTIGTGEQPADLAAARTANMDAAMKPIAKNMIPLQPQDVEFLRQNVVPNLGVSKLEKLGFVVPKNADGTPMPDSAFMPDDLRSIHNDLDLGQLSLRSADTMRQKLNGLQVANPGGPFKDLSDKLVQQTVAASPEYSAAVSKYAQDSNYIDGHAHGYTGKTLGQVDPANTSLRAALDTPEGQQGFQSGQAARLADHAFSSESGAASTAADLSQQAATSGNLANTFSPITANALRTRAGAEDAAAASLRAIAPNNPAAAKGIDPLQAGLAVASHGMGGTVLHGIKALAGVGMSDAVARKTAQYLTDPRMAQQGYNLMAHYNVSAAQTRALMQKFAVPGATAAAVAGGN